MSTQIVRPMTEKIFFSYATVAPMRRASYEAVKKYLDHFYYVGPPDVLYYYDHMHNTLANETAQLLNCDPSEITYTKNTTDGINIAADTLPLEKGDEVLVLENEYPANLLPWLKKQKDGITVKILPGRDNAKATRTLIKSIGPKTKVIAISAVQSYDGYMVDLAELSAICRKKGIFLVVDAAQLAGIRTIDLQKTPVDFLVSGGQKYLRAGPGIGFMYVNRKTMSKLRDTRVGIRSMERFDEHSYSLKDGAARFQDGTQNLPGIAALTAALQEINRTGIKAIEKKNVKLLKEIKLILDRYEIPYIDHGKRQGNIIALTIDDPQGLTEYLKERAVYIKPMKDVARISFIDESRIEDVETVAKLIHEWLQISQPVQKPQRLRIFS